jgi:hypothetical protein
MSQSQEQPTKPPKKTRWGCLSVPIILTLLIALGRVHDVWYDNQPLEVHLRDVFRRTGFMIPDDVTNLKGFKGETDFHGDFSAGVTFSVRPDQIDAFMHLPADHWQRPNDFKPHEKMEIFNFGGFDVPSGSYVIMEHFPSDYYRIYAVNKTTSTIYFFTFTT